MKLLDFYTRMVNAMGMIINDDGRVSAGGFEPHPPIMIENRRLCMPTDTVLAEKNLDECVVFHPLCEMVTRGESEVLSAIKQQFTRRLGSLFIVTFTAAANQLSTQDHLPTAQAKWLQDFTPWTAAGRETVVKFIKAMSANPAELIKVYIKTNGIYKDKPVNRLAVVTFPILDELDKEKPLGVMMAKRDRAQIKAIVLKMFPKADVLGEYSHGDSGKTAPRLAALVGALEKLFTPLNAVAHMFRKQIPSYERYEVDISWIEQFEDAREQHFQIPPMSGNMGVTITHTGKKESAVSEARPVESAPATRREEPAAPKNDVYAFLNDRPTDDRRDPYDDLLGRSREPATSTDPLDSLLYGGSDRYRDSDRRDRGGRDDRRRNTTADVLGIFRR